jgi:N-acetylglucosaminyl-diphospho-decaprenol L-rhamnosyltransferase
MSGPPLPPMAPEVSAVVPTVGRSPWLAACLEALRRQGGAGSLEIVVVDQAPRPLVLAPGLADRVLRPERNLGFAGGTNLGIAAAGGELVATVNDDAVVDRGWLAALAAALRADPDAAAAQGVNLLAAAASGGGQPSTAPASPAAPTGGGGQPSIAPPSPVALVAPAGGGETIDGCGLGWNRWWQAVQLGRGEPAPDPADMEPGGAAPGDSSPEGSAPGASPPAYSAPGASPPAHEVFGVSATAALFRRAALQRVARRGGEIFDPRLVSYYEDVELAGRLRAAGYRALLVPAARARHAGSASGRAASRERWRLIYGNRYLAAAGLLGSGFWPRLPLMALRDLLDLLRLFDLPGGHDRGAGGGGGPRDDAGGGGYGSLDRERLAGMLAGWGRAARHLPAFVRRGPPAASPAEVARLSRLQLPSAPGSAAGAPPPQGRPPSQPPGQAE